MIYIEKLINELPQASVLEAADRVRWLKGIEHSHSELAEWHAKRLFGFGGSEIGAILRHELKSTAGGFSTAQRIIEQKLLKRLPERQTIHMLRGTTLEHLARLAFMYRYGATPDHKAISAMSKPHGRSGYEWLVGNPDDIVKINGKRLIPDYKVPSHFSENVDYDYDCQLHHYALGAQLRGIKVDGLVLAKLDLDTQIAGSLMSKVETATDEQMHEMAQMIAKADMPGLRVVAIEVPLRREMQLNILDIGKTYWNEFVVKGQVPDSQPEPMIELSPDGVIEIAKYQAQYALASAGAKRLGEIKKRVSDVIKERLINVEIANHSLPVEYVNVGTKNQINEKRLAEEAKSLGASDEQLHVRTAEYSIPALLEEITRLKGDITSDRLFVQAFDSEKAKSYVVENDGNLDACFDQSVEVSLSRKKAATQIVAGLADEAEQVYGSWMKAFIPESEDEPDETDLYEAISTELGSVEEVLGSDDLLAGFEESDEYEVHVSELKMIGMR